MTLIRGESTGFSNSEGRGEWTPRLEWPLTFCRGFSGFLARARMRLIVDLGQMLPVEMGIDLRGADTGVAEHFLDGA